MVVNTIASHHGDVEPVSSQSLSFAAAGCLECSSTGARSESLESYIKRLQDLEEIANSLKELRQVSPFKQVVKSVLWCPEAIRQG